MVIQNPNLRKKLWFSLLLILIQTIFSDGQTIKETRKPLTSDGTSGKGPSGFLWVTLQQWDRMAGGRSNNPLVKPFGEVKSRGCKGFAQIESNGCWQSGCYAPLLDVCLSGTYRLSLTLSGTIAPVWDPILVFGCPIDPKSAIDPKSRSIADGYHGYALIANYKCDECYLCSEGRAMRVLVNPGNSVEESWIDWDSSSAGNGFPLNSVFGDESNHCQLRIATYIDSSQDVATDRRQAAQVDKKGNVYWNVRPIPIQFQHPIPTIPEIFIPTNSIPTYSWDNNEYKLLATKKIKEYHIINIEYKTSQASQKKDKLVSKQSVSNHLNYEATFEPELSLTATETSEWNHGIAWNHEISAGVTWTAGSDVAGGSVAATLGHSISLGGSTSWTGSSATEATATSKLSILLHSKHGVDVTMTATKSYEDVPYEATVRITYDDDTTKTVKDVGTWKGVVVTNFKTKIGEEYPI